MYQLFQQFGRDPTFLLLLVHVLPFTMLLKGSMLALFLQLSGKLLSVTKWLIQLAEMVRFILLAYMLSFYCG